MSFPRYPAYKDSGVEWLGEVPGHWEVWKLAHAFAQIGSGTTPKTDNREYYDGGDIPWVNTGDLNDGELDECEKRITALAIADHSSLKTYPAGSLLIAMYGATIGKLAMLNFAATVNQACCVFAGKSEIVSEFMFYWFLGLRQQIISLATGGGQPNISQDILRSLRVACPPLPEQTQIAAFLNRETAKIDELVTEQRRLMALLKEKRQAVISHAVTRGLNPHAPMKPSGIEWLGDVPEHWVSSRLAYVCDRIVDGTHHSPDSFPEGEYRYVTAKNIKETGFDFSETSFVSAEVHNEIYRRCPVQTGDILYIKDGATAGIAMANDLAEPFSMLSSVALIRTNSNRLLGSYLVYQLNSTIFKAPALEILVGGAMTRFTLDSISRFYVSIPPFNEQQQIVVTLDRQLEPFRVLITEAQRTIDLLQERRTALISAAVTGQIDVRGAVDSL